VNTSALVGVNLEALLQDCPVLTRRESLEHSSTLRDKWGGISLDGVVCKQCDHGRPTHSVCNFGDWFNVCMTTQYCSVFSRNALNCSVVA